MLVLIGVMAAAILSVGFDTRRADLIAEVDILRGHVGFVQSLAMANNTVTYGINFTATSYSLQTNNRPTTIRFPGEATSVHALPPGIRIVQGTGTMNLDQWGAPTATRTIALSDGRRRQQLSILRFTGMIQ